MAWIVTDEVQLEYKVLESAEVATKIPEFILSAQDFVYADLDGYIDMDAVLLSIPFPKVLEQLAKFKAQEKALIYYYQEEQNSFDTIEKVRDQYNNLVSLIRNGQLLVGEVDSKPELGSSSFA